MNANQMITAIEWLEVSSCYAADCRDIMRAERHALAAAVRSGEGKRITEAMDEARRVAKMWGVDLANIQMPAEATKATT